LFQACPDCLTTNVFETLSQFRVRFQLQMRLDNGFFNTCWQSIAMLGWGARPIFQACPTPIFITPVPFGYPAEGAIHGFSYFGHGFSLSQLHDCYFLLSKQIVCHFTHPPSRMSKSTCFSRCDVRQLPILSTNRTLSVWNGCIEPIMFLPGRVL